MSRLGPWTILKWFADELKPTLQIGVRCELEQFTQFAKLDCADAFCQKPRVGRVGLILGDNGFDFILWAGTVAQSSMGFFVWRLDAVTLILPRPGGIKQRERSSQEAH